MSDQPHQHLHRVEIVGVVVVTLVAAILRLAFLENIAVEHFDEGVYASSSNSYFWFAGDENFTYPYRHLYAPPLVPALIRTATNLFGPSPLSVALVALLPGIALIPLIWWVGRSWFDPAVGIAAAVLAAGSEFHIAFSRMALTDSLLGFLLLLAVYLLGEAVRRESLVWAVIAGVATSLAWWTKYNGWLPLAIGIAGTAATLITSRAKFPQWKKPLLLLAVAATVAFLLWSPFLVSLQAEGGYAAVAGNHRQYIVGLAGWAESFRQQLANHRELESWMTPASIGLAWLAAIFLNRFTCNGLEEKSTEPILPSLPPMSGFVGAAILFFLSFAYGSVSISAGLAIVGLGLAQRRNFPKTDRNALSEQTPNHSSQSAGNANLNRHQSVQPLVVSPSITVMFLAAWFFGLLFATPFYRPYPRLILPWLMATWLGTALLFQHTTASKKRNSPALKVPLWKGVVLTLAVVLLLFPLASKIIKNPTSRAHERHTGLQSIAHKIITETTKQSGQFLKDDGEIPFILSVYGEPALFFHLGAEGAIVQPVANLSFLSVNQERVAPIYLITGPHAHRSPDFANELKTYSHSLQLVGTYEYQPSTVVLLNEFAPWELPADSIQEIRLYKVRR